MGLLDTVLNRMGSTTGAITIDYPQKGETLSGPRYTFRISAPGMGQVEVTVDGAEWLPCRAADGYWWLDWNVFPPGKYSIMARGRTDSNEIVTSRRHAFTVR
jgi:hypothetical protein